MWLMYDKVRNLDYHNDLGLFFRHFCAINILIYVQAETSPAI